MDWTLLFIVIGMVLTGAVFIGYPIGYIHGGQKQQRALEPVTVFLGSNRRLDETDVLSAKYLEEAER